MAGLPKFRFSLKTLVVLVAVVAVILGLGPMVVREVLWMQKVSMLRELQKTNFLQYGYPESISAASPHFVALMESLAELPSSATDQQKYEQFRICVFELNQLDADIETVEREEFCRCLREIGKIVDLLPNGDRGPFDRQILEWRDW